MSGAFHCSGPHGPPGGTVHLVNGYADIRVKSSEGCTVLPCGCAFTDWPSHWRQMCAPAHADFFTRHADALLERATRPDKPTTGDDWLAI